MATWPSGKAEACKAFTPGSNPGVASSRNLKPRSIAPGLFIYAFFIDQEASVKRKPT